MRQIFLLIILASFHIQCFPQSKMTKKEILIELEKDEKMWKDNWVKDNGDLPIKLPFNNKVIEFVDSLRKNQVDTIGVYSAQFIGFRSLDSCDRHNSPWESYVQWKKNNSIFHRTIRQFCNNETISINYSAIIDYYNIYPDELKKEKIIPVITKADRYANGNPNIIFRIVDHTPNYSIFCMQRCDSIIVNFTGYNMDEKENIFYNENNSTHIHSWLNMIKSQINEIEKK